MGSEKIFCAIVIVLLLVLIHQNRKHAETTEKMFAANWTGQPGAYSVRRTFDLVRV